MGKKVKKLKKIVSTYWNGKYKNFTNNFGWLIGYRIFSLFISVFISSIIARYFGPKDYGLYNYGLAYILIFSSVASLGLESIAIKEIIDKKNHISTILGTSFVLQLLSGILLSGTTLLLIYMIEPNNTQLHKIVFVLSLSMLFKPLEVADYLNQAYLRSKITSLARIFAYLIISILNVIIIIKQGSIFLYSGVFLVESILVGTFLIFSYRRYFPQNRKWAFDAVLAKKLLSQSWFLILSGLVVSLYSQIDKIMLGSLLDSTQEVGIYSIASQIGKMWYFVPLAIISSYKPIIMKKKSIFDPDYIKHVQLLYDIIAWIGILFSILLAISSKYVINILFGSDYRQSSTILQILVWSGIFATLGTARGIWMICENIQKYTVLYVGIGALMNIILNFYLIPIYGGIGAAFATLVTQIIVSILSPMVFSKTRISATMILKSFDLRGVISRVNNIIKVSLIDTDE